MFKKSFLPMIAAVGLLSSGAAAQSMQSSPMPMATGGAMMHHSMMHHTMMHHSMMHGSMGEHGMPSGTAGGDGTPYTGAPDLQGAVSLVTAGGPPGSFSITQALTKLVGAAKADAEVDKLTKQYGKTRVASFVAVQNYAVDDAVKVATAGGVKFPKPMLHGAALASHVVKVGLEDGTYYEGVQLDHLVTHAIHEHVMDDIDHKYGRAADANYHRIADQAHYDLAHALGMTNVKLASYH